MLVILFFRLVRELGDLGRTRGCGAKTEPGSPVALVSRLVDFRDDCLVPFCPIAEAEAN